MKLREFLGTALEKRKALRIGPLAIMRSKSLHLLQGELQRARADLASAGVLTTARWEGAPSRRRSVLFLHNSYYNFFYLAAALRKRGWDALSVSLESPDGPHAKFYHGEDLNLFDADAERFEEKISEFYSAVQSRFSMVHFYGRGHMSFFPSQFDRSPNYDVLPMDFLRLKQCGIKIGYSVCGCLDGVAQSSVNSWSGGCCNHCPWQTEPAVCTDRGNLAWGHKFASVCDLIATEGFPALDWQSSSKAFREPLTTAVDSQFWRPDLAVPEHLRIPRTEGEFIVYHGVGNFSHRSANNRDVKGTRAVVAAVERLRQEGRNVSLKFVTDLPNTEVRFLQVQADVIVDQLNYGRYGAQAREGMMLGKPTICFINKEEPTGAARLRSIEECPLVSANEDTVYDVLRDLLANREKREKIGAASREFALKWHSAEACAARFEQVYDNLMTGKPVAEIDEFASASRESSVGQ